MAWPVNKRIKVKDWETWKACKRGEWLSAIEILPYGYPKRDFRLRRLVERGICKKRINGYIEEFFADPQAFPIPQIYVDIMKEREEWKS